MPTPDCVLPDAGTAGANGQVLMDQLPVLKATSPGGQDTGRYMWLYLLRPANPFDSESPLVAVDSVRFPSWPGRHGRDRSSGDDQVTQGKNAIYSIERLQPITRRSTDPGAPGSSAYAPFGRLRILRATLGPESGSCVSVGRYGEQDITEPIVHTLGGPNRPAESDWDYFPFLDRDFTSLAEVLLVPRCRTGTFHQEVRRSARPRFRSRLGRALRDTPLGAARARADRRRRHAQVYPYLADEFFYSAVHRHRTRPRTAARHNYAGGPERRRLVQDA